MHSVKCSMWRIYYCELFIRVLWLTGTLFFSARVLFAFDQQLYLKLDLVQECIEICTAKTTENWIKMLIEKVTISDFNAHLLSQKYRIFKWLFLSPLISMNVDFREEKKVIQFNLNTFKNDNLLRNAKLFFFPLLLYMLQAE